MNSKLNIPARVTVFAVLTLLVIAAALTLPKLSTGPVFAQSSPPGSPTGLTATAVGVAGANAVELSWTAPVAGRDSITHYVIETSDDNAATWESSVNNTETVNTASGVQTYHAVTAVAGKNLYRVSAVNSAGTGDPSGRASATPPVDGTQPDQPDGLTATANGSREINLSWTALTGTDTGSGPVTQYKIEYSKNGSLPWMDLGTTTVTTTNDGTEYSNTGLAPDTERHYRVSAVNIAGRGPVSDSANATTTLAGVPAAPTGLRARAVGLAGTDMVVLSWTAPAAGGAPIEYYKIETSGDNGATWTDSVDNTETDNTASGVQTYHLVTSVAGKNLYRVSAINTIGTGPVSATVEVTPPVQNTQPSVPLTVAALKDGSREIEVTWTAPTTAGVGPVTQYKIEYSKDGNLPWMDLATVQAPSLKYSNTGLAPGTTRHYRVSAVNKAGRGPASDGTATMATTDSPAVTSEPGKPTGLTATAVGVAGANAVELSWTAPVAGRDSITHYVIETSDDNAATWESSVNNTETVNTASGVQTYHAVTAVAGKNLYRVSAVNSAGTGDPSGQASATPPVNGTQPDQPDGLTATANGSREINLSWTALTGTDTGSGPVTQYKIEYSKNGSLPWMDLGTTTVTTTNDGTEYSNTGLAPDTERHYRVSAVNIAGRGPVSDSANATTTLAGVPAAPTGLRARAVGLAGTDMVELSWTAPAAGGAPIEYYKIETSGDNGATWTDSVDNTETDNTASGVQTYHLVTSVAGKNLYRVSAINTIGTGPVSATVEVTPPVQNTQPSVPLDVAARADGSREIEVTWTAPTTAGVGPVTQYKIEYSKDGNQPWMELATTASTATKYENTGLDPDTTRHYRVSAVNEAGRGPASDGTATMATTDDAAADQPGDVTLSTQEPMAGMAITATLTDDDGGVTSPMWQWEKSMDKSYWMDATGTGAMTMRYTPVAADAGYYLRATVEYTDENRSDRIAQSAATNAVTLPPDQMGIVTLSTQEPLVDMAITATLRDSDGTTTAPMWQWKKSMDKTSWMDATGAGATTSSYTPAAMDEGYYLQATVTYTDPLGPDKMANSDATTDKVMVPAADPVLTEHDANKNNRIDYLEVVAALRSFLAGDADVPYTEVITVYRRFLGS